MVAGQRSVREVGKAVQRPYTTIHSYLKEEREPPASFIADFCRAFEISEHWLLTGEGPMQQVGVKSSEELDTPVAREATRSYKAGTGRDLNELFDRQMGILKHIRSMGKEGREFADVVAALIQLKEKDLKKYRALMTLFDVGKKSVN